MLYAGKFGELSAEQKEYIDNIIFSANDIHQYTQDIIDEAEWLENNELFSKLSFALRTALNNIIGYSGLLIHNKAGHINPDQRSYLNEILNSSGQVLQLANTTVWLYSAEQKA